MKTSCHRLEYFEASERMVVIAAQAWWQANGYIINPPVSSTKLSACRGSNFGVTDHQTKRVMDVILKPIGDGTAVSVYHQTSRILFLAGVMFGNILERETDSFLQHLSEYAATEC